jgi:hypothetical protein
MAVDVKELNEVYFPNGIPEGLVTVKRAAGRGQVTLPQWDWVVVEEGQFWVMPEDEATDRPDWDVVGAQAAGPQKEAPPEKDSTKAKGSTGTTAESEGQGG